MAHTLALLITKVHPNSQGEAIGLKADDAVLLVNGTPVIDNHSFSEKLRSTQGEGILTIERDGQSLEIAFQQGPLGIITDVLPFETKTNSQEQYRANAYKKSQDVIVTTAPTIESFRVVKTIEVISAECAFGINIFRDLAAGVTDIFGGRSTSVQKVLRDARRTALQELKIEAASIGANAVIATSLDYSEFTGKGTSMLFLVASGTAVIVEPST